MTATYDNTDLTTETGSINIVRLLLGDTDVANAELQDEEIAYYVTQSPTNLYLAASFGSNAIASKYAKLVDTQLDGALSADYSDLYDRYRNLATQLKSDGNKYAGSSLGVYAGGLPTGNTRNYVFYRGQFEYPFLDEDDYLGRF